MLVVKQNESKDQTRAGAEDNPHDVHDELLVVAGTPPPPSPSSSSFLLLLPLLSSLSPPPPAAALALARARVGAGACVRCVWVGWAGRLNPPFAECPDLALGKVFFNFFNSLPSATWPGLGKEGVFNFF